MPTNSEEQERLKRLHDQQIKTRYDPNEKRAKYDKISVQRRQGTKVTGRSILKDIPDQVWWSLAGGLVGLVFYVIVTNLPGMPSYGTLIGAAGIGFGLVVGFVLGKARQSGKEDWGGKGKRY
jgi:hypothetical protein